MKCNNCGKDVYGTPIKCPHCFSDLSYYNPNKGIINKHGTFFNSGGLSFLLFVFPLVLVFGTIILIGINVLSYIQISNIILKMIFYFGLIALVLSGVLTLKNNIEADQADPYNKLYKPKKKGIALGWTIVLIILLIYPNVFRVILKKTVNLEGVDYEISEYIKINDIEIPSIYSAAGEIDIIVNLGKQGEYDVTYGFKFDSLSLSYSELTQENIQLYELKLTDNGYSKISIINEEKETVIAYVKNNYNNTFVIVCIIDSEVTYAVAEGKYEDYFHN